MTFHDAYLVESFRDENGSPRQRTISYLGNIRQIEDEFPTIERELFMLRAEIILESLPEVSPEDRKGTLEQLRRRVPPLDSDEVMLGFKNTLRWYCRWWQENGGMPSQQEMLELIKYAQSTTNRLLRDD